MFVVFICCGGFIGTSFQSVVSNGSIAGFSKVFYVDRNNTHGPWDGSDENPFRFIQDAIDASSAYDHVNIGEGIYFEQLFISKPLSLFGDEHTIIDGSFQGSIVQINSMDVRINNIAFKNSGGTTHDAGIVANGNNLSFRNCVFYFVKTGLGLNDCFNVLLYNCSFFRTGQGLNAKQITNLSLNHCNFKKNAMALSLHDSDNIKIVDSAFEGNGMSCYFEEVRNIQFSTCNISDNSVNKGGLFFNNCENACITDCVFIHNGVGVSFSSCQKINISYCDFIANTHFAISLRTPSIDVIVSFCNLNNGLRTGIYIESNNDCLISDCNIINNTLYGLNSDNAYCDARYNWWGSSLGPYIYCLLFNKLAPLSFGVIVFPWAPSMITSAGNRNLNIPICPCEESWFVSNNSIDLDGVDTDDDFVPDWWERKWGYDPNTWDDHAQLDPDDDALTNIDECYTDEYGSNPFKKDVFLEIDWMQCTDNRSNKPSLDLLQEIVDDFSHHDINLHIDIGLLGGGEEILHQCDQSAVYTGLHELYWQYFLHDDIRNPRKGIFRYGIVCSYCPDLNFPFMGWDELDSFAISAEWLHQEIRYYSRQQLIVGGIAHHLGHTLGLIADKYNGIDNVDTLRLFSYQWIKHYSYRSCMNYWYKFRLLTFSDGSQGSGDFNDWENMDFHFFKDSSFKTSR
jgi:hypothetical protein